MKAGYVPQRGDAIWLDFDPQAGHEQARRRPALVLSPFEFNRITGFVLVCPITNQEKGYPFEVPLPAGLPVRGVVLADQIRSLDWKARKGASIGPVPSEIVELVVAKIDAILYPG